MEEKTQFSLHICALFSFQGDFLKKNKILMHLWLMDRKKIHIVSNIVKFEKLINIIHDPKFHGKIS